MGAHGDTRTAIGHPFRVEPALSTPTELTGSVSHPSAILGSMPSSTNIALSALAGADPDLPGSGDDRTPHASSRPNGTSRTGAEPGRDTGAPTETPSGPPLVDGLPAGVDEVPLLGVALEAARAADRAVARLLECLLELDEHQVAETLTRIPLEQWLAIVGRRTRSDRRMLFTACTVLRRLPSLAAAFLTDGSVSWAQTRSVVLQVERLPRRLDEAIDAAVARTVEACRHDDPDALTTAVSQALRSLEPATCPGARPTPPQEEFVAIQPRLDGSGGSVYGELGAVGLATVDAALTPPPDQLRDSDAPLRGAAARARARRLVELCDTALAGGDAAPGRAGGDDDTGTPGTTRADRAPHSAGSDAAPDGADTDRAPHSAGSDPGPDGADGRTSTPSEPAGSRPQLLVRVPLASLLDGDGLPGELLTRLTGGKLWADAATVQRLVEARGADLRTVLLDDTGRVVGVGRSTRIAPGWLRDATLALHDTCSAPGCAHPARSCDVDHARPWHPTVPGRPGGRTDVDELAPLCRRHNRTKEAAGWQVTQEADGTRRWRHPATGLATTTRPATWQPPGPRHPTPTRDGTNPTATSISDPTSTAGRGPTRDHPPTVSTGDPPPTGHRDLAGESRGTYDPRPPTPPCRAGPTSRARLRPGPHAGPHASRDPCGGRPRAGHGRPWHRSEHTTPRPSLT